MSVEQHGIKKENYTRYVASSFSKPFKLSAVITHYKSGTIKKPSIINVISKALLALASLSLSKRDM
jgi:hypothetical protein